MALVERELDRRNERHPRERRHRSGYGHKRLYRVKARDEKNRLVYFKTRTKLRTATIKRLATVKGVHIEDVR